MGRVNIEIPDDVHKRLKIACIQKDTTLIEFINGAIKEKLKRS